MSPGPGDQAGSAALEGWLATAVEAAGAPAGLVGDDVVTVVLDLARDAAHALSRPAAPLAAFAAGLALGRATDGGGLDDLRAVATRITTAARAFGPPQEGTA